LEAILMSLIGDAVQAFLYIQRQQGWRVAFSQAAQFLRSPFFEFHQGHVLRKSLQEPVHVPAPEVIVSIRQAGLEDLALLETIVPPLRVKRLAKKMQAGEICFVAIKEQRAVAYVLAGFANTPSTEDTRIELDPKEAYLWAAYVLPPYRRQGVLRAVNLSLCRLLQDDGYESVVLQVDRHNEASLGHCYKMGYSVTDRLTFLRILGWRLRWCVPIE
jgi:ribosomal protein S18 acetylase RimI-like enzyme